MRPLKRKSSERLERHNIEEMEVSATEEDGDTKVYGSERLEGVITFFFST